ncbi:MAG: NAD(P)-dependent oxidoreductase [Ruminococcus sp.]|nr:NAD(P)-dependent oxidoreductase [Ruminococcus sp.]MDE6673132.1 NAD(P)-dependent oxidoreductase [Ruminococcus sp.]MDE6797564.1 NAD(P)-dependent oxidoreductase [Ruminococcus sp.]
MNTILVMGGCGLIGQHVCSGLLKKGNVVISVDEKENNYNTGKLNYSFVESAPDDEQTYAEIFRKNKIDIVIHAGCTVDNDFGPIVTDKQIAVSAKCDSFIYEMSMNNGVKMFILLSTDQVYEFTKSREPIREEDNLKPVTNYAILKVEAEKAFIRQLQSHKNVIACIIRNSPVYTHNFVDNLTAKITDPKDNVKFVSGTGQYGFQLCCVHNLVDFILCFVRSAVDTTYSGTYNVSDKHITTATQIISFMRENHNLGTVISRSVGGTLSKIRNIFSKNPEEKENYRYLDMHKLEHNNMLDCTKASKIVVFRWDINNTK